MERVDFKDLFLYASETMLFQRLLEREPEPEIATEITALWMWFQTEGYGEKLTSKISENDDDKFFSSLVEESMAMLAILDPSSTIPFSPDLFPTCATLLSPSFDSLTEIFNDNKETVLKGIESWSKELIFSAFNDFEKQKRHTPEDAEEEDAEEEKEEEEEEEDEETNPNEANDRGEEASSEWSPKGAPEESRCLLLTFSNGYPLTERQILNFFTKKYGPCIEKLYIHHPENASGPPLFAKVVFTAVSIVAMVLGGEDEAKFVINRMPVWCKKFDAGRTRPAVAPPEN